MAGELCALCATTNEYDYDLHLRRCQLQIDIFRRGNIVTNFNFSAQW